jgi:hypothetical protein
MNESVADKVTVNRKLAILTFGELEIGELFVNRDLKYSIKTVWRKTSQTNAVSILDPGYHGGGWAPENEVIKVRVTEIVAEEI